MLGAEGTGKTTLGASLAQALRAQGQRVTLVPELLRDWSARQGRAARPEDPLLIAREQERQVDAAAGAGIVIADTTALMVAIHGAAFDQDSELYRFAIGRQRSYDLTLVAGLDLPWAPDSPRRSPRDRESVDALVRATLSGAGIGYRVVYGRGEERLRHALAPVLELLDRRPALPERERRWQWACDRCSDPECEHRLFTGLRPAA
nr:MULTISPECIES: AAA family ATPase [Ramlibacter]